jgi:hypothetical protein
MGDKVRWRFEVRCGCWFQRGSDYVDWGAMAFKSATWWRDKAPAGVAEQGPCIPALSE